MKKATYLIASITAAIQFTSCSNGPKEIAPNPENDSVKISQMDPVPPKVLTIGGNDFTAIALSAEETRKTLIDGSKWMWFATFVGNADDAIFARYQGSRKNMKDVSEPIGDTLTFAAPDKYTHVSQFEPGKQGNESYSNNKKGKMTFTGNFEITDQHNLILNNENDNLTKAQYNIAVLTQDVMFVEEPISFEGTTFTAYKRYIRIGDLKK